MKSTTRIVRLIAAVAVTLIAVGLAKPLGRPAAAIAATTTATDATAPVVPALTPPEPDVPIAPSVVPEPAPALPSVPTLGIPGCFPTPVTYCVRTVAAAGDRTTTLPLALPAPLDVDGNAIPDVVAQLLANPGIPGVVNPSAKLSATRLQGDHLPLYLEASLGAGAPGETVAFGYDTFLAGRSAPATFEAQINVVPDPSGAAGGIDATVTTTGTADQMDLIGYRHTLAGTQSGRARLQPVPNNLRVELISRPPAGKLKVSADRVLALTAWVDATTTETVRASAQVQQLPTDGLELTWDTATKRVTYGPAAVPSTARATSLAFDVKQYGTTGNLARHLSGRFTNPGTTMTVVQDSASRVVFDSSPAVGQVEFGMATARPVVLAPVHGDYVKFVGPVASSSVAARVTGLSHVVLETADPMRVEIKHQRSPMTLLYTNGARSADAFIQALPANVDLRYSIAEQKIEYQGTDVIHVIEGHASDPAGLSTPRVTFAHLVVRGLPTSVSLRYEPLAGGNGRITYDGPVAPSAVEVGFATNRDVDLTGPPGDFVRVRGNVDNGMAATRITGLSHAVLETGDPIRLEVRHSRVPMTIDQANGGQSLHALVDPLPANVDLRYSPAGQRVEYHGSDPVTFISADTFSPAGLVNGKVKEAHLALSGLPADVVLEHPPSQQRISYRGSAGIAEIRTDVRDSNGLVGRAKKITSLVRGLPSAVDVSYATSGSGAAMTVEAKDPAGALVSIGLVEVLLTSGPEEPLPAAVDGVRIVNRPDRWMVFGRVTGLKRAAADRVRTCQSSPFAIGFLFWSCRSATNLTLDTTAARVAEVDIRNQAAPGAKEEYVSATLDRLMANVSVSLIDESAAFTLVGQPAPEDAATVKTDVSYLAPSVTNSLTFRTNAGRNSVNGMTATLSPLPRNLRLCTTPTGSGCIVNVGHWPSTRVASKGSMSYSASDPAHLALADCVTGDCTTWGDNSTCAATSCTFNRTAANRHGQGERLWIKNFDMASHYVSDTEGSIYLNTQRNGVRDTLAGNMLQYEDGTEKLFAVLGSGLAADRFTASWKGQCGWFGCSFTVTKMNWISCPPDMHLYAGWLDLKGIIC